MSEKIHPIAGVVTNGDGVAVHLADARTYWQNAWLIADSRDDGWVKVRMENGGVDFTVRPTMVRPYDWDDAKEAVWLKRGY